MLRALNRPLYWCAPVAFCFISQIGQAQNPNARVLVAANGWSQDGHPLVYRSGVETNVDIVAAQENTEILLDCGNTGWFGYTCKKVPCTLRVCTQEPTEGVERRQYNILQAGLAVNWAGVSALFRRQPLPPALAVSRTSGNPSDAVIRLTDEGADWAPALLRIVEGEYCFLLRPLPVGENTPPLKFDLKWDRGVEPNGRARVVGVKPGLFELRKGLAQAGSCQPDAQASPAWVLIVDGSAFDRSTAEWRKRGAAATELERSGASVTVVTTLRHAILAELAEAN